MMVILGGKRGKERETPPSRHNKLPPFITWGHQRHLRCSKTDPSSVYSEFSGDEESPEPNLSQKEKRVFFENKNYPSDVAYEKKVLVKNKNCLSGSDVVYESRVFVGNNNCPSDVAYEKRVFVENKNCPSDEVYDKRVFVENKNLSSKVAYEKGEYVGNRKYPSDVAYEKRVFVENKNFLPELSQKDKRVFVENRNHPSDLANEGIDKVREKVIMDLKAETDRIRVEVLGRERFSDEREGGNPRPWKLRDRRVRVKVDGEGDRKPGLDTVRTDLKSSGKLREQRPEFSVCLSRSEVEEDFAAMVGHRPPRRPKKRPKAVQKKLDNIFPGLWLPDITPDLYKVDKSGKK